MHTRIALALAIAALSACAGGQQEGAVPVDMQTASKEFFRENPDASAAALLNTRGKGFEFYEDGKAFFVSFGATSNLRTRTGVSSIEGNTICLRAQGGWSGACMDVFQNPDGTFFVEGEFGNGANFSETLSLQPVFDS